MNCLWIVYDLIALVLQKNSITHPINAANISNTDSPTLQMMCEQSLAIVEGLGREREQPQCCVTSKTVVTMEISQFPLLGSAPDAQRVAVNKTMTECVRDVKEGQQ